MKFTSLFTGILVFTFSSIAQIWPPANMKGDGTENNPWQITKPEELAVLSDYLLLGYGDNTAGKYYKLMNNIDLIEYKNWKPIGSYQMYYPNMLIFQGNFNGNGKIIKNLTITRPYQNYIGFFGNISNAKIEKLGIENCNIFGKDYVGGLAGKAKYSVINECYVAGNVEGTGSLPEYAGGLIGYIDNPTITNCYTVCNVKGSIGVGGLVGAAYALSSDYIISTSYSVGTVTARFDICGGLAGSFLNGTTINCVAINNSVILTTNAMEIGRIIGDDFRINCYNNYALNTMVVQNRNGDVSIEDDLNSKHGMGVGMGMLKSFEFYANADNWLDNAWDISSPNSVWKICDGKGLPFLRWQNIDCDLSIEEFKNNKEKITVYPNPTKGELVIINNEQLIINNVGVLDILGRKVLGYGVQGSGYMVIDVSELAAGVFFVRVVTEKGVFTERFVKQ